MNEKTPLEIERKELSAEEESERQKALAKAEEAYQDINSKHYRDNERFSWAVKTINKHFYDGN